MRLSKNKGSGSTNCGAIRTLEGNAKRPPRLRNGVANDVAPPKARSAVMPAPTTDTTEPYRSTAHVTKSPSMKRRPAPQIRRGG